MSGKRERRAYKVVEVAQCGSGYALELDGTVAKTPGGADLVLPTRGLAGAIAEEWRRQRDHLDPRAIMLTRLAYFAIDAVRFERGKIVEHAIGFGRTDVLCYRAEAPEALGVRQKETWDPMLEWARETFGLRLATDSGIAYIEQPSDALPRIQELAAAFDDFALAAFDAAATATASFVLALALVNGRASADTVFEAALLDELWQARTWGRDADAEARRLKLRDELLAVEGFVRLLRQK